MIGFLISALLFPFGIWHLRNSYAVKHHLRTAGWITGTAQLLDGGKAQSHTELQVPSALNENNRSRSLISQDEHTDLGPGSRKRYAKISDHDSTPSFSGLVSLKIRLHDQKGKVIDTMLEPIVTTVPVDHAPGALRDSAGRPKPYYEKYNRAVEEALLSAQVTKWQGQPIPVKWISDSAGKPLEVYLNESEVTPVPGRHSLINGVVLTAISILTFIASFYGLRQGN